MEIDSVRPSEVVAMDTSHKCTEKVHPHVADPSFMTPYKFVDQPPESIYPQTLEAITNVMKLERLTEIQHKTLHRNVLQLCVTSWAVPERVPGRRLPFSCPPFIPCCRRLVLPSNLFKYWLFGRLANWIRKLRHRHSKG
jgi:hypothetical protein